MEEFWWREYIVMDPKILNGKPIIKGTRISVEFILNLLAAGWTEDKILDEYPTLTREALRAALAFAAHHLSEERTYLIPTEA